MWLRGLGEDGLAGLLTRRPEAATPPPESLVALAQRLMKPGTVIAAMRRLNRPTLQVGEALAALGAPVPRATLVALLGKPEPDDLDRALGILEVCGLLRRDDVDHLILMPTARLGWRTPLGLGPPAQSLLQFYDDNEIRTILRNLEVPAPARDDDLGETLARALAMPEIVGRAIADAPEAARSTLLRLADTGETVELPDPHSASPVTMHLASLGLLMALPGWDDPLVMPAEVGLVLRGAVLRGAPYVAPFEPRPPACAWTAADGGVVGRDTAAHAGDFLRLARPSLTTPAASHSPRCAPEASAVANSSGSPRRMARRSRRCALPCRSRTEQVCCRWARLKAGRRQ